MHDDGDPQPARAPKRSAERAEAVASALLALIVSAPFWRPDGMVRSFDGVAYSAPNVEFTLREWKAGRLPLWNDSIFGGVSHLGNLQTGALYLVRFLFAGFRADRAIDLMVAAHLVLLVLTTRRLVSRLGLRPPAGFVAALIVGAGGAATVKTIQFEQFLVLSWTPLLLLAAHAVITSERRYRAAAGLAAVGSATLLAGHPQITYQTACLLLAWTAAWLLVTRDWSRWKPLAVAGGLMVAVCALQLLATLHATSTSAMSQYRSISDLLTPGRSMFPDRMWATLFGSVRRGDPGAFVGSFESIGFVGVVALVLATVGAARLLADRARRWLGIGLVATAVVATFLALGARTIVYRAAWHLVPGFDLPRIPARWLDVTAISMALLAAYGIDGLVRDGSSRAQRRAIAAVAAIVVITLVAGLTDAPGGIGTALAWLVAAALAGGAVVATGGIERRRAAAAALVVLAVVELGVTWSRTSPLRPRFDDSVESLATSTTRFLQGKPGFVLAFTDDVYGDASYLVPGLRPNTNVLNGIRSLDGYDGGLQVTKRWLSIIKRERDDITFDLPLRNHLSIPLDPEAMARLDVHYALIAKDRDPAAHAPEWTTVAEDDRFEVRENPAWRSDATLWYATRSVQDADEAAHLLRGTDDLSTTALVESDAEPLTCDRACEPIGEPLERISPREMEAVTNANRPGVLVFGTQFDSGWKATIDGDSTDVVAVDGFLVGVPIPGGVHTIRLTYEPSWLGPGVALTILGVLALVGLVVLEALYHRRYGRRDAVHHG